MLNSLKTKTSNPLPFAFCFAVFHPRAKPTFFQKELVAFKRLEKQYRMKNILAYWDRQTKIENDFIGIFFNKKTKRKNPFLLENFDKQQEKKRIDDALRYRSSIVNISFATRRNIVFFSIKFQRFIKKGCLQ